MRYTALVCAMAVLSACASPANRALNSGDSYNGCRLLVQQGPRNHYDLNNIGYCYGHGHYVGQDPGMAIRYWTQAARYGNTTAISNLASAGAPVPPADLAQRSGGFDPAAAALGLQLMQMGQPRSRAPAQPLQRDTNCLSSRAGPNVMTQCSSW